MGKKRLKPERVMFWSYAWHKELLLDCISMRDTSRALDLAKRGFPDLVTKSGCSLPIEFGAWVSDTTSTSKLASPSPEIIIQILALSAFHTNRSRKISMLPCALGDTTIGTSKQQTKEMGAKFWRDKDAQR